MKNIILFLSIMIFVSCKKEIRQETVKSKSVSETETVKEKNDAIQQEKKDIKIVKPTTKVVEENPMVPLKKRVFHDESDLDNLLGYYVGSFRTANYENVSEKKGSYSNKINISIDHIKNDSLFGHSVVAGNARPFKGAFDSETLSAKVYEPGDDKYDGVFEFAIQQEKEKMIGTWIANNKNLAVPVRRYKLDKREFAYDPELNLLVYQNDYDYNLSLSASQDEEGGELEAINPKVIAKLNASTNELTNQDIENLNKGELEVLRNLIYARHGYSFKNRKMRYFFDTGIDWYIPVSTDIRKELTDLEKKNIALIKRYEQHAERYYDYFGR